MNFATKSEQKANLKALNKLAEKEGENLRDALLIIRNDTTDLEKKEELNDLYYAVPYYLSMWTKNKRKMFKSFPEFVSTMDALKEQYNEVKNADICPVAKDTAEIVDETAKDIIKDMLNSGKKVEDHNISKLFDGLKVTVNAHYVYRNGSSFIRCFWYLNGNVTAYNKIVAIVAERKKEVRK
jgi:hypothetical protein